jgi:hypothetical protein
MSRPDIKQDGKTFTSALRGLDKSAGNGALRAALGWSEGRYWKVRDALIEANKIVKGRGCGGSVALA